MPNVAADDFIHVRAHCSLDNQLAINVFAYKVGPNPQPISDAQLAEKYAELVAPLYIQWLTPTAQFRGIQLQVQRALVLYTPVTNTTHAGPGEGVGEPYPKQICGLTSKLTGLARATNRGRVYWPFPAHTVGDATGAPSLAQQGQMDQLAGFTLVQHTFTVGINSCVLIPYLLHKKVKLPNTVPPVYAIPDPTPLTGILTRPKWATQRRRGDFGHANQFPF